MCRASYRQGWPVPAREGTVSKFGALTCKTSAANSSNVSASRCNRSGGSECCAGSGDEKLACPHEQWVKNTFSRRRINIKTNRCIRVYTLRCSGIRGMGVVGGRRLININGFLPKFSANGFGAIVINRGSDRARRASSTDIRSIISSRSLSLRGVYRPYRSGNDR